jgi:hypothetical protein
LTLRNTIRRALISIIAAGCLVGSSETQTVPDTVRSAPGIVIETSVDIAEIFIGDLITYSLSITHDSTYQMEPPPLGANLGAFDVKDYQADITSVLPDGRIHNETIFKLTTFTTGDYLIPPIPVLFILPDSSRKVVLSESVPIKVKSMLAEAGDSLDIRPLKAQYEFLRERNLYYLWGGLAALLLVVAILWWIIRRKRSKAEMVDLRPPWEIAFEKLALLKQRHLVDGDSCKQYYVELTEIAREYIGRIYDVDVLEMTTAEFMDSFQDVAMPNDLFENTENFLKHADLVKFAKFSADQQQMESDFDFVYHMTSSLREDYERRQQVELSLSNENMSSAVAAGKGGG